MKHVTIMPQIDLLVRILDQAYDRKAWHGTTLRGSLRGLTPVQAAWRPAPQRHNIWEIVIHAAYWKYAVRRRLLGERRGNFPLKGSNWFVRPLEANPDAWSADVALLDDMHRKLRQAVVELPEAKLPAMPLGGSKFTNAATIYGISSHDLYHAGQIQLLKRLQR